jgi:hypothetical protein
LGAGSSRWEAKALGAVKPLKVNEAMTASAERRDARFIRKIQSKIGKIYREKVALVKLLMN